MEFAALGMFVVLLLLLLTGYPVAFALAGTALLFTLFASDLLAQVVGWGLPWDPVFRFARLSILPQRVFGSVMNNYTLVAVPFFIFMGAVLERSGIAEDLLRTMGYLFGELRGGMAISVVLVGTLLAATTGVVGASVVTLAVLALPVMLKYGYDHALASGTVAASGTLGQVVPPSIILIVLGDQMDANVGDLFLGAFIPGLLLSVLFSAWIAFAAWRNPAVAPALPAAEREFSVTSLARAVVASLLPPLALVAAVLGTIFFGIATPTEAGAMGAAGALLLACVRRRMNWPALRMSAESTVRLTAMVFTILVAATVFGTVFSAMGGTWLVEDFLRNLPGGEMGFLFFVMLTVFLLGFFLDFIEISFIVVPLVAPVAIRMGFDPVWFGVLLAVNLQTSFLTPPFGFSLFYLRGAAPAAIRTSEVYRGIVPFIALQLVMLGILVAFPGIVTWLPSVAAN